MFHKRSRSIDDSLGNDPTDLIALERDQQVQEELVIAREFQSEEDFRWVLSDQRGRRFLWGLLEEAGVYAQPFVGNRELTDFNCGRKDFGLKILARLISQQPGLYAQMIKEAKEHDDRQNSTNV